MQKSRKSIDAQQEAIQGLKMCSWHKPKKLPHFEWCEWAEKRVNKGMVQKKCPICNVWFFDDEMGEEQK